MNNSEITKPIYLSDSISDREKKLIVRSYFRVKSNQLTLEIDKQMNNISRKYLENYYKKTLGNSWRNLIKKYKIFEQPLYLISEPMFLKTKSLSSIYFDNSSFSIGLRYYSDEEYPRVEDFDITDFFSKCKSKKKIVSLLYEKQKIKDDLVSEMFTRGIMNEYSFLPGINTYEDLYVKYPDVFDLWIQDQLKVVAEVEVITVEEEVNKLKNFLEC